MKKYMSVDEAAELCHEANRALCIAAGDLSQLHWKDAADWQRKAIVQGVRFYLDPENDDPRKSHSAWCQQMLSDGWKYGTKKSATLKLHPCLVPYELLPMIDRAKDLVFNSLMAVLRPKINDVYTCSTADTVGADHA